jgi:glycosyltransferase involved in cell wall biosynthesis
LDNITVLDGSPLVSVIMNCYNSDRYLKEAIESVYAQSYQNWEIIFWDNCSTDNSAKISNQYDSKLKYFVAEKNTNLGKARNLAMKKANGKYISFLDCDDLFLPEKLRLQVSFMENSDYVFSYGSSIIINESGAKIRERKVKNKSGYLFPNLLRHYEVAMQSVMIDRSTLTREKLNFDERLSYSPDYNLFMKVASRYEIGVINQNLIKYRFSSNSLSSQTTSIASCEMRYTLDYIFNESVNLENKYKNEAQAAYDKVQYYRAVSQIYENNKKSARNELFTIRFSRIPYFALYLLLFLPFSNQYLLKLLGR